MKGTIQIAVAVFMLASAAYADDIYGNGIPNVKYNPADGSLILELDCLSSLLGLGVQVAQSNVISGTAANFIASHQPWIYQYLNNWMQWVPDFENGGSPETSQDPILIGILNTGLGSGDFGGVHYGVIWTNVTIIPEPACATLLLLGCTSLLRRRRR